MCHGEFMTRLGIRVSSGISVCMKEQIGPGGGRWGLVIGIVRELEMRLWQRARNRARTKGSGRGCIPTKSEEQNI